MGVTLDASAMTPAQCRAWEMCLDLSDEFTEWAVVGGQMVWLHATCAAVDPLRSTEDMDVVVDLRAAPGGLRLIDRWLHERGVELQIPNSFGQSHRYIRRGDSGDVEVSVDVLAPDHLGERADLTTRGTARTIAVPGGSMQLKNLVEVTVSLNDRSAMVRVPRLSAAIAGKAEATRISGRDATRDWTDAALLLALIEDPLGVAESLSLSERHRIPILVSLASESHHGWRPLPAPLRRRGLDALGFLLAARVRG